MRRLDGADLRPVHVDGRLHPWEWRRDGGAILKLDGIDHSCGHDLVGAQDILWDVAGACVEFHLSAEEVLALGRAVSVRPEHIAPMAACYAAFQAALLSLPATGEEVPRLSRRRAYYRDALARLVRPA